MRRNLTGLGWYGVLVEYEGAGNGACTISDCLQANADRYLIDLVVPPTARSARPNRRSDPLRLLLGPRAGR